MIRALLLLSLVFLASPTQATANAYSEALTHYKTGSFPEALESINQALEKNQSPAGYELKGRILAAQKQIPEAINAYEAAIKLEPQRTSVHFYVGELFFQSERWSEALGAYRYALEQDKEFRAPILKLIYCLILMENYPTAHKWITSLDPTNEIKLDYYFARAAMAFATEDTESYSNALRQARTIYGTSAYNRYEPDLLKITQYILQRKSQASAN